MSLEVLIQETNLLLKVIAGLMVVFLIGLGYDIFLLQKEVELLKRGVKAE